MIQVVCCMNTVRYFFWDLSTYILSDGDLSFVSFLCIHSLVFFSTYACLFYGRLWNPHISGLSTMVLSISYIRYLQQNKSSLFLLRTCIILACSSLEIKVNWFNNRVWSLKIVCFICNLQEIKLITDQEQLSRRKG